MKDPECPKCGSEQRPDLETGWWDCGTCEQGNGEIIQTKNCARMAALRSQLAAASQLKEAAEKERDRMARMYRDGFDVQRVMEWQRQPNRREPHLEFTAGGERDAAHLIEDERRAIGVKLAAAEARAAGLTEAFNAYFNADVTVKCNPDGWWAKRDVEFVGPKESALEAVLALLAPVAEEGAGDGK